MVTDVFIGILARHLRRYLVSAFIMEDISIEIMVHLGVYLFACCHQLYYEMRVSTPSVLRFLSAICHKCLRYTHAFTEKAQHLRRWISLRTFTRGRLVPRQPRAIKSTTRTELRDEVIVMLISLIMKHKMICAISSCKIWQIISSFEAFCRPICLKSFYL